MQKVLIIVIDGCAPEYLTRETAPNIFKMSENAGSFAKTVQGAIPSVTNVNHACIMSGFFPEDTHVVGNYYYDPNTGDQGFIEGKGFMKAPTILEKYKAAGGKTSLLTVKGKILEVFGAGVDIGISVQKPDPVLLERLDLPLPPQVQSPDSSRWIFEAAYQCIRKENPDLVYCTTNDFVMHHYGPETSEAQEQIRTIDEYVAKIHDLDPNRQIYITADHGMNQKKTLINLQTISDEAGFHMVCVPPLKDRYIENHIYQEGGILYLYLKDKEEATQILELVSSQPAVEQVLPAKEAAALYHLPEGEIGDYVAFAAKDCAFGEVDGTILHTDQVRTHGSLYERTVPLIAVNAAADESQYAYSKDIVRHLL
ncbi:alkaline phosphatase family protein [Anaerovorax odorimutans]|uniref:Alkaline phosphatase family protein n=1 Tax=Anaerovorax odorimutans TaxID=109327 RepID=A0ABT1RQK4_9FIRM|nr:alkaline phosphatase family protein [Anaerovorax odorimutans]MCQ4637166.1 alkaline phosphatase family protein [Anaerovorax odorimutans]